MGTENKSLFSTDSIYTFHQGVDVQLKYSDTIRNVSPDFLERILTVGGVTKTDLFLLRAVLFYRIATAEMVAEFLQFFRHYYGAKECEHLLVGGMGSDGVDPLSEFAGSRNDISIICTRLCNMSKKHLLFSYKTENSPEISGGGVEAVHYILCFTHNLQCGTHIF